MGLCVYIALLGYWSERACTYDVYMMNMRSLFPVYLHEDDSRLFLSLKYDPALNGESRSSSWFS
jgi:hypothetical protein